MITTSFFTHRSIHVPEFSKHLFVNLSRTSKAQCPKTIRYYKQYQQSLCFLTKCNNWSFFWRCLNMQQRRKETSDGDKAICTGIIQVTCKCLSKLSVKFYSYKNFQSFKIYHRLKKYLEFENQSSRDSLNFFFL